eukprot:gene36400-49032_t
MAKRPTDINQRAKSIVDIATGEAVEANSDTQKNAAAVLLGRLGGLKGGAARANSLTPERRAEIAKKAAAKRPVPLSSENKIPLVVEIAKDLNIRLACSGIGDVALSSVKKSK